MTRFKVLDRKYTFLVITVISVQLTTSKNGLTVSNQYRTYIVSHVPGS